MAQFVARCQVVGAVEVAASSAQSHLAHGDVVLECNERWLRYYAMHSPPNRLPQAHAIARELLLVFVLIHRLHHISAAKKDLKDISKGYRSLKHFREAATQRSSFFETLLLVSRCFSSAEDATAATSTPGPVVTRVTRNQASIRVVNLGGAAITGKTPKKKILTQDDSMAD